ncbi:MULTISPECIES: VanZ family protein [Actinosynnema]|uniref:VanZ family protein n=1 Tax=Actinosynnema TaxID=40566 RepID=UPI0020A58388|nr:VanZ family protein [Actinosynnema pretiosum]
MTALLLSVIILFTPASGVPSSPPGTDKVVHAALFALLALTALHARLPRAAVLAGLVAYAGASEVAQHLLTGLGRSGDVADAVTDVAGIGLGWLLHRWLARRGGRVRGGAGGRQA